MADYRSMYLRLADEVERALDILDSRRNAEQQVFLTKAMLAAALQDCEDMYVETEEAQKPPAGVDTLRKHAGGMFLVSISAAMLP